MGWHVLKGINKLCNGTYRYQIIFIVSCFTSASCFIMSQLSCLLYFSLCQPTNIFIGGPLGNYDDNGIIVIDTLHDNDDDCDNDNDNDSDDDNSHV